jgi:hypothetical protein
VNSFADYLTEKMNEKGFVAPVTNYFSHRPQLYLQADIPKMLDLLQKGRLHPLQKTLRLNELIPTQDNVSIDKVYNKYKAGDDPKHPIVVLYDRTLRQHFIIDGHHRASALILGGVAVATVTVIDSLDVARFLH